MKTTIKKEVFNALCDYLIARKAYSNKKECLNDLQHDSEMVIGTLIYLDAMGEPNAIDMYYSYMKVLEAWHGKVHKFIGFEGKKSRII